MVPPATLLALASALRQPLDWTLSGRTHSTVTLVQFDVCLRVSLPRLQGHEPKIYTFISAPYWSFEPASVSCGVRVKLRKVCIGRIPLRQGLRNLKDEQIVRAIAEDLDKVAGETAEKRVAAVRARLALDMREAFPDIVDADRAGIWIESACLHAKMIPRGLDRESALRLQTIVSGIRGWAGDRLVPIEMLPIPVLASSHERIRAAEIVEESGIQPFRFKT
jgi:hypothetical protein